MKIAIAQTTTGIDPDASAKGLVAAMEAAAANGAAMLFTPEMSGVLDSNRARAAASIRSQDEDPVLAAVRDAAARLGLWVHLGSLALRRDDGRLNNRGFVINAAGAIAASYDKLHLYDVDLATGERWRESATYCPGERAVVCDTPVGRLGLAICYDLRFPDLFRALSDAGARCLAVPSAFTRPTGAAHWHILLRARAIEAAAFVIAAAQTGIHEDGRRTFGHSLAIDPWGDVLLDMGEQPGIGYVDLNPTCVDEVRGRIPVIAHRRPIPPIEVSR